MKLIGPESKDWKPNSKAHDELCRHLQQLPPKIVVNACKEQQFAKKTADHIDPLFLKNNSVSQSSIS